MKKQWGLCKGCKWWQLEPEDRAGNNSLGLCIEEHLQAYRLRVNGASGCNEFQAGRHPHVAGSAAAPPTAEPKH